MEDIDDINAHLKGVRAELKWFNGPKGFGFVVPVERPTDAFLHITTLQKVGYHALGEGAELICDVAFGSKGAIVTAVQEILYAGDISEALCKFDPEKKDVCDAIEGTVKWYKEEKGFGFVIPDDGMKDVFIHKSCLDKQGLETLEAGQRIRMAVKNVPKGREAVTLEVSNVDGVEPEIQNTDTEHAEHEERDVMHG